MSTENLQTLASEKKRFPNALLELMIEGKVYPWEHQYINGAQIKDLAGLSVDTLIYLSVIEPWKDEQVLDDQQIDLAATNSIEQFYVKKELFYFLDDNRFVSDKQFIKGRHLRKEGKIPDHFQIFLKVEKPWEDELIKDSEWIDLARPGVEHFYSKKISVEVILIVNARQKPWDEIKICFIDVIKLAYNNEYIDDGNVIYSVTYSKGPKENPEGMMAKGEELFVKNKMEFNVARNNKS